MVVQKSFGQILLPNDPGAALQASTKQYVDNNYVPTTTTVSAGTGLTGGGALSSNQTLTVAYGTSSTTACVGNDSRVTGAAPAASPSFTGTATFGGAMVQTPVALTDASTIAINAALGNTFRVLLTASGHTVGNPSNSTDGQMIMISIQQPSSGGPYTVSWGSNYEFGTDVVSPTLSTAASKIDYVGFIYSGAASKWHGLAWARGY